MTTELPTLTTSLSDKEVLGRLETTARRGKLAGFAAGAGTTLFRVRDFGTPFESELTAERDGDQAIRFTVRLRPTTPTIFVIVMVLTIWPGVWVTESFMKTYFPHTLATTYVWWWYLILTVPFVPFGIRNALRKSRAAGDREARTVIEQISSQFDAD